MIPVLMYHIVDDENDAAISIPVKLFQDHVAFLKENGYHTLSVDDYIDAVKHRTPVSKKAVLITFDDAYVDVIDQAAPVLLNVAFTATIFVVGNYTGKLNWWNRKACYLKPHMTWEQVHDLARLGFDLGAHTLEHHCLVKLSRDTIHEEMFESKRLIEENTGAKVKSFSYPYGDFNSAAEEIARELFEVAFSVRQGSDDCWQFPYRINRWGVDRNWTVARLADELSREPSNLLTRNSVT